MTSHRQQNHKNVLPSFIKVNHIILQTLTSSSRIILLVTECDSSAEENENENENHLNGPFVEVTVNKNFWVQ